MSYGANGIEQLGEDAPSGQTVGQKATSLVGFHGNATPQGLTGTYFGTTGVAGGAIIPSLAMNAGTTGIIGTINNVLQLLKDKGLDRSY